MLVREDGPFEVIKQFRELTGIEHDEDGNIVEVGNSPLGCIYCTSVWVALALLILPDWISKWLAISGVALVIEKRR